MFLTLSPLHGYLSSKGTVQLNIQERGFYYIYSLYFHRNYSYMQSWELRFFKFAKQEEDLEEKESPPKTASCLAEDVLTLVIYTSV